MPLVPRRESHKVGRITLYSCLSLLIVLITGTGLSCAVSLIKVKVEQRALGYPRQ